MDVVPDTFSKLLSRSTALLWVYTNQPALKSLTGEASNIDHLVTAPCSAGTPWGFHGGSHLTRITHPNCWTKCWIYLLFTTAHNTDVQSHWEFGGPVEASIGCVRASLIQGGPPPIPQDPKDPEPTPRVSTAFTVGPLSIRHDLWCPKDEFRVFSGKHLIVTRSSMLFTSPVSQPDFIPVIPVCTSTFTAVTNKTLHMFTWVSFSYENKPQWVNTCRVFFFHPGLQTGEATM